jgi:Ca2+-binding EF-hand superfamily protein
MRVLKRALMLPAAVLALCAAEGRAAESSRMEAARATFGILDMDGDEKVTFKEFALRKMDAFSAADRNSDGNLEEGEVFLTREQFAGADEDQDGRVRLLEFIDSRYGQFDIYDGDSNGTVDLEEFTRNLVGD